MPRRENIMAISSIWLAFCLFSAESFALAVAGESPRSLREHSRRDPALKCRTASSWQPRKFSRQTKIRQQTSVVDAFVMDGSAIRAVMCRMARLYCRKVKPSYSELPSDRKVRWAAPRAIKACFTESSWWLNWRTNRPQKLGRAGGRSDGASCVVDCMVEEKVL